MIKLNLHLKMQELEDISLMNKKKYQVTKYHYSLSQVYNISKIRVAVSFY